MVVRRVPTACAVVVVVASISVLAACDAVETGTKGENGAKSVPANVTVHHSIEMPPELPAGLRGRAGQLGGMVDFHDQDFSGVWYEQEDGKLHVGVASPKGQALLVREQLTDDPSIVIHEADRSLLAGQRLADEYVKGSAFGDSIVSWGALPQGDGIHLSVQGDDLTADQLGELGALPVRVVVTLGQGPASQGGFSK